LEQPQTDAPVVELVETTNADLDKLDQRITKGNNP